MLLKQSQSQQYKPLPTRAESEARAAATHRELAAIRQDALAMKEETLDMRVRLWLQRIADKRANASREKTLECVLDAAIAVASADFANIQLAHRKGSRLIITAQRGFHSPFLDFFEVVDNPDTACGVALAERRSIVVGDITSSAIFAETEGLDVLLDAGIRAVNSMPVIDRTGELIGILSVHWRQPQTDAQIARLQTLATGIAALINR